MAAKPTEVRRLVEVLNADYDSAEDCAKAVFKLVEEMLWNREHYVTIALHSDKDNNQLWQAIGPYPTRNKAFEDCAKRFMSPGGSIKSVGSIALLRNPSQVSV